MNIRLTAGISVLALLAACASDDSSSTATTAGPVTTVAPSTTGTPTTVPAPPSTTAPPTTASPTTTLPDVSAEQDVAFATSGQQVTTITFEDPTLSGLVIHSDATGDFEGPVTSALVGVNGVNVALVWFEGRVADCGSGGLAMRIATRPDGVLGWEVVPGLGVGDLATVTGSGDEVIPNFTGTVRCDGGADPTVFATTLLLPPPADAADLQVDPELPTRTIPYPLTAHPQQQQAPQMWLSEDIYGDRRSPSAYLGVPFPQTSSTPVRQIMVSSFMFSVCEESAVVRMFIDDLLYPEFRGAWDVLPGVNNGNAGGGVFTADENSGRLTCA